MNLPNLITVFRIAAVPVIATLVVIGGAAALWAALILYVAAAASDWLDGFLARRMNISSALGRMLDPIADKLLVGALIVVLAAMGRIAGWHLVPALAILLREIFVSGLREFLGNRQIEVPVTTIAKYKTAVQLVAFGALLAAAIYPQLDLAALGLLWIAGALTVWTGSQYFTAALPRLK